MFCGKNIESLQNQKSNEVLQSAKNGTGRFDLGTLQKRLERALELKNRLEKEIEDFNDDCVKYQAKMEKALVSLEKDKDDAKKKLDELMVLRNLEEISETDHNDESSGLIQRIKRNERDIIDAQSQLKELNKIRKKLVKLTLGKKAKNWKASSKKRLKEKLTELELAYKDEKIGTELYKQLKLKYQTELQEMNENNGGSVKR